MAAPNHVKQQLLESFLQGNTVKVLLLDDSTAYTYDQNTHEFVADVADGGTTGTEMSGTGYSRQTLSTAAGDFVQDDTNNRGEYIPSDVTFSGLDAGTIQSVIVYKQIGGDDTTPGDDPILAVYDDDSADQPTNLPLTTNGSDVTISIDAEGLFQIS